MEDASCLICFEVASQPRMCPKCSKIFCAECIANFYQQSMQQVRPCPHCRGIQHLGNYVKANVVEDLAKSLERKTEELELANSKTVKAIAEDCSTHPNELKVFYCIQYKKSVCRKCLCKCGIPHMNIEDAHEDANHLWNSIDCLKSELRNAALQVENAKREIQRKADLKMAQVVEKMRNKLDEEIAKKTKPLYLAIQRWESFQSEYRDKISAVEEARKSDLLNQMVDLRPLIEEVSDEAAKIKQSISTSSSLRDIDVETVFLSCLPDKMPAAQTTINAPFLGQSTLTSLAAPTAKLLRCHLIDSPPLFQSAWNNVSRQSPIPPRFPIGEDFAAGTLNGQVIVWGGDQTQENTKFVALPKNAVYSLKVKHSHIDGKVIGSWTPMKATGEIHDGYASNASAICEGKLYIHGGNRDGDNFTTTLSTLSSAGHFTRLKPTGDIPAPRIRHRSFSLGGKVFLLGGLVSSNLVEKRRERDFVKASDSLYYYNNDFHQYDPDPNSFTRLSTTGKHFLPRSDFDIATLGNCVYVYGGYCNRHLNDFLMLDMSDMSRLQWTEIEDNGFPTGIYGHSFSPISSTQLLLVGGVSSGRISNEVRIFDVEKSEWKKEAPLPAEFGGSTEGLSNHTAVAMRDGNSAMVICLGGYIDSLFNTHPNHIAVFEIPN